MITEDYVSFETAKLLKEKGFDGMCVYINYPPSGRSFIGHPINNTDLQLTKEAELCIDKENLLTIPTLQMTMKWLRVVHNINLSVVPHSYKDGKPFDYEFVYWHGEEYHTPYDEKHPTYHELFGKTWKKYEEACDVAIKYFLENLI